MVREARRLLYWAWIARDMGHDVTVHLSGTGRSQAKLLSYPFHQFALDGMPKITGTAMGETCDLYVCSNLRFAASQHLAPRYHRLILMRESFPKPADVKWCHHAHVVIGPVWRREDFTDYETRCPQLDAPEYLRACGRGCCRRRGRRTMTRCNFCRSRS